MLEQSKNSPERRGQLRWVLKCGYDLDYYIKNNLRKTVSEGIPGQWVPPTQGRGVIEQRGCKARPVEGRWIPEGHRSQVFRNSGAIGREEVVVGGFWGICLKRLADKHQAGLWVSCSDERPEGGKARQDPGRDTGCLNCDDAGLVLSNFNFLPSRHEGGFRGVSDGKEILLQCWRLQFNPWSGAFLGEGNGYLLLSSCLENPMDDSHGWLAGYSPWGSQKSDMMEWLTFSLSDMSVIPLIPRVMFRLLIPLEHSHLKK